MIPSFNGAHKLSYLLHDLTLQSRLAEEVIVVLDGSTDDSLQVLATWADKFKGSLQVMYSSNGGRAVARNKGANLATGDLLVFFDDDVRLHVSVLERHEKAQQERPEAIHFGFALLGMGDLKPDPFSAYRIRQEARWNQPFSADCAITTELFAFTSQNFSVQRSLFTEFGGFDERLRDSEDFDLAARWIIQGRALWQLPELRVGHRDNCSPGKYISRQREYKLWKSKLLLLHPEYRHVFKPQFTFLEVSEKPKSGFMRQLIGKLLEQDGSGAAWIPDRLISYYLTVESALND